MKLNHDWVNCLQSSNLPWIEYNLTKKLAPQNHDQLANLKKKLLADPRIQSMLTECQKWPEPPLTRHNDTKHIIHIICLLLDFGLDINDPGMAEITNKILKHQADNGAFLSTLLIPKAYGGSDEPSLQWLLCDFPILLYILISLGFQDDPRVVKAIQLLKSLCADNGWRCVGSVPKFRGPGRKEDHCPYATLISLKVFSLFPEFHNADFVKVGIDALFYHWEQRTERKIYMFAMGTDFKKLKYPNFWFDITHVVRVLSKFEYARQSKIFEEMVTIIREKQLSNGGFIPESVYMEFKGWDFGQKKDTSPSLTYTIGEIFDNLGE